MSKMMLEKEWLCSLFEIVSSNHMFPFLQVVQTNVNTLPQPREKVLETTSRVLGRGMNPNCSP
jgi:hypothetical protein